MQQKEDRLVDKENEIKISIRSVVDQIQDVAKWAQEHFNPKSLYDINDELTEEDQSYNESMIETLDP